MQCFYSIFYGSIYFLSKHSWVPYNIINNLELLYEYIHIIMHIFFFLKKFYLHQLTIDNSRPVYFFPSFRMRSSKPSLYTMFKTISNKIIAITRVGNTVTVNKKLNG